MSPSGRQAQDRASAERSATVRIRDSQQIRPGSTLPRGTRRRQDSLFGSPPAAASSGTSAIQRSFRRDGAALVHSVKLPGSRLESSLPLPPSRINGAHSDPRAQWMREYLLGALPSPVLTRDLPPLRTVDLFCGAGGFSLGIRQLAAEAGRGAVTELAADIDEEALSVFGAHHPTRICYGRSVTSLVDFRLRGRGAGASFAYEPEVTDRSVRTVVAGVDLVAAGPPCQGHSNLNNRSRRDDRRNRLFLTVPAFAVAAKARAVAIENVPAVVHDRNRVVQTARSLLEKSGYVVMEAVLAADALGWPQTRRRYFLVASRIGRPLCLQALTEGFRAEPLSVSWALDGADRVDPEADPMRQLSELSERKCRPGGVPVSAPQV